MKVNFIVSLLALTTLIPAIGHAQGTFQNLDFEDAVIVPDPLNPYCPYAVYANQAIPGWTAVGLFSPSDIFYIYVSGGATSVSLLGTEGGIRGVFSPLDGAFSVLLCGGATLPTGASISQTGLVPADARSILFKAWGFTPFHTLFVSLGGQNVSFSAISTGPGYTLYSGDISAFAGQTEQLTFSTPLGVKNYWKIDDIQFSSRSIPEPSTLGLLALGALAIAWRSRSNPVCDLPLLE
jgi:hypothetical protein